MDRVRLRVLAPKSKLGFGKFETETIAELFEIGQEEYLAWVYYNASNISFCDEILDCLKCERIEKPGNDKSKFAEWKKARSDEFFSQLDEEHKLHAITKRRAIIRRIKRAKAIRTEKYTVESKARLQARNHGHIK